MGLPFEECSKCKKKLTGRRSACGLQCNGRCKLYFCQACAKVSEESFKTLMSDIVNLSWICSTCKGGRKSVVGACASPVITKASTSKLIPSKKPAGPKEDTNRSLEVSKDFINSKFEEMKSVLDEMKDGKKLLQDRIIRLENKFTELESIVHNLEANCDRERRKSLENNVIVKGIPVTVNENLNQIICFLSSKMGLQINTSAIVKSVRLNYRPQSANFDGLLITFADISTKKLFVDMFRQKKDVKLIDVMQHFQGNPAHQNTRILVRDDLTKLQRELFRQAKCAQEDLNLKFVWMKNGDIFARKFESSRVFKITNKSDISTLYEMYSEN